MLVFEPFDPKIDPPNPPKKVKKIKFSTFQELINDNNYDMNQNINKKEKEK